LTLFLTKLQKQLCNALQKGLPICWRPFAEIAKDLDSSEEEVLQQTRKLKSAGIIRRIGALLNYHTLGMISTLVAAHVPQENIQEVADAVNSLENVSHNYLRAHYYNLWFTLQAQTDEQLDSTLAGLSCRFGIDFHSLPARHVFKLDVRFDAEGDSDLSLQDVEEVPKVEVVEMDKNQKQILSKLQGGLDVTKEPFTFLCSDGLQGKDVLRIIRQLIDKGVIRRIAAVVDHRKLGFESSVLFACEVPESRVIEAGRSLARFTIVSHCYQRNTFEGWPYNLFAMMHGRNISRINRVINKFTEAEGISSFQLLPTLSELKKQPVKYRVH
jgi:siroheme decarboxylase